MAKPKQALMMIADLEIDCEVQSTHDLDSDTTDNPVEVGADITDNIRPRPIRVNVRGIVSDSPLGALKDSRTGVPSRVALARLMAIREAREPVPLATSLQNYTNMVMESLSITRDKDTGFALEFAASFKQVIIAANTRTAKRTAIAGGKSKVDNGNKPTTPVATKPPKAPTVDPNKSAVRRIPTATSIRRPTAVGGSGFAPPGYVRVASGGSGLPTRIPTASGGGAL